jgi:hypothetical protein
MVALVGYGTRSNCIPHCAVTPFGCTFLLISKPVVTGAGVLHDSHWKDT